jgi:hypothetical protein
MKRIINIFVYLTNFSIEIHTWCPGEGEVDDGAQNHRGEGRKGASRGGCREV